MLKQLSMSKKKWRGETWLRRTETFSHLLSMTPSQDEDKDTTVSHSTYALFGSGSWKQNDATTSSLPNHSLPIPPGPPLLKFGQFPYNTSVSGSSAGFRGVLWIE